MSISGKKRIALFTDGRPGHEKQSQGIVSQLGEYVDITTDYISCSRRTPLQQAQELFRYFFKGETRSAGEFKQYDLLVGTGTHTHLPMLFHKRKTGSPAVTCMTPARVLVAQFDIVFSPLHDGVGTSANVFTTVGPPGVNVNRHDHDPQHLLILIGGKDEKSHRWETASLVRDVTELIGAHRNCTIHISSSPRTPQATEKALHEIAEEYGNVRFFPFAETPAGWVEQEYGICKYVWITADSISMVYEALSSGCMVGVIPVRWKSKKNKFIRSIEYLHKEKMIISLSDFLGGGSGWREDVQLNEAQRCAEEIIRRLRWNQ